MDSINFISINKKDNSSFFSNKNYKRYFIKIYFLLLFFLYLSFIFFIFNLKNYKFIRNKKIYFDNKTFIKNKTTEEYMKNLDKINIINYNQNILQVYKEKQNNFCENPDKYYNHQWEDLIGLTNFSFKNISYQIYVYKKYDNYMSKGIIRSGQYESKHMSNFLEALKYYSKVNKITNNKDIFILDIGGNIGTYPSFLAKFGYSILTFEASPRNYYILNKNYCHINKGSNIFIINKGISNIEKKCNYFSQIDGIGNGILLCDEKKNLIKIAGFYFNKTYEVTLTKLSSFLPYLSNKNIAIIKLDIEGGEGKAIEGGIELIIKYHVPYIFSEYNPNMLKRHGTNPIKFLQLFINNGYKISLKGFLSKSYVSIDKVKNAGNLYFIYNGIQ